MSFFEYQSVIQVDLSLPAQIFYDVPVDGGLVCSAGVGISASQGNVDGASDLFIQQNVPAKVLDLGVGAERKLTDTAGTWIPFPISLRGALMIRPVVGDATPTNTPDLAAVEHPLEQRLNVYPNPGKGMIYLDAGLPAGNWTIQVVDMLGQHVVRFPWSTEINMTSLPNGWYTLLIQDQEGHPLARRQIILQD